jgi:DNA invertase Pin-like site-specific DNA recombinase
LIKIKVPIWFYSHKKLPRQALLRTWKKVSSTGRTLRGPGYRIGETHHRSKLTDHDVELIRILRESGMKLKEIAKKFECSPQNVSAIVNYQSRTYMGNAEHKVFE